MEALAAAAAAAVELSYQAHHTRKALCPHGFHPVEKFQNRAFAWACCLGASPEVGMGLEVDLEGKEDRLLLTGAES